MFLPIISRETLLYHGRGANFCSEEEEDMEGTEEVIEGAMVAAEVDTMARDLLILK